MPPKLPLSRWIDALVNWIEATFGPFLQAISNVVHAIVHAIEVGLLATPWWVVVLIFAVLAYLAGRWRLTIGTVLGFALIWDLGLWRHLIITLVLVLLSALCSIGIGLPLGIWSARRQTVFKILSPILDLMQTMPSFVYLVPVLIFFNIGLVPAVFATVVFAMPPAIRLTRLGILQVPSPLVEAAQSFGSSDRQLLWKVQVPLAMPSIMAGINQTVMLSLSMVVIASMIGAGGLGSDVLSALENIDVGQGFEAGMAIVILAIVLDRLSQKLGPKRKQASL